MRPGNWCSVRLQFLIYVVLVASVDGALAGDGVPPGPALPPPVNQSTLRAEIARGAAAVAAATGKKYPYSTAHRLIRNAVEKNIQDRRDSDAYRLGAHLAAAFWVQQLPSDLTWRDTVRARHADIVVWLMPRVGLPPEEVAQTVAQAEKLTPASEKRLLRFLQELLK